MTTPATPRNRTTQIVLAAGAGLALCLCLLLALGLGGFFFYQRGQTGAIDPAVIYILDASPRMTLTIEGGTRLEVARAVLAEVVRPADTSVKAGLRTFGTGAVTTGCEDTDLLVPLAAGTQSQIADMAFGLTAGSSSDSALAEAMLAAIKDLAAAQGPHTLVVITGGADSCNTAAGDLIKQEAERAGIQLQEFVIGLGVTAEEALAIKGIIEATSGTYLDAPDTDTLRNTLLAIQAFIEQPSAATLSAIQASTPTAASPAGYQSQTACDHPYAPYRPGATWTDSSTFGQLVWSVQNVSGDLNSAVLTITLTDRIGSFTYTAECTPQGIGIFELNNYSVNGHNINVLVSNQSGVGLLPADQLIPGAAWNSSYLQQLSGTENGVTWTSTSDISQARTAGEIQTLTTTLGTFEVIPVTLNQTSNNSDAAGNSVTTSCSTLTYYAYGVGVVRLEQNCSDSSYTSELESYSVP